MKDDKYHFPTLHQAEIWAKLDIEAELTDRWVYEDRDSEEAFVVLGFVREEDDRRMRRTVWMVPPGYRTDEPPLPWPLYHLPELRRGGQIYVCQDEVSADRLRKSGLLATTAAHGPAGVDKSDWAPLAGREAIVLPHNNEEGRVFARRATAQMTRQSPAAEVRVLALPGLGVNGTVGDFIDMRHPRDLRAIGEDIADLAELTPEYWQARLEQGRSLRIAPPVVPTALAEVAALPETKWLWAQRLVMGRLNLVQGVPGAGQSLLGADIAARVSTGAAWPDGNGSASRGSVLLVADPRRVNDTIAPALARAGADARRIITLAGLGPASPGRAVVAAIERAIEHEPGIRLAVIDPLSAYFSGNLCFTLAALEKVAAENRLTVVLIGTLNCKVAGLTRLLSAGGHMLAAASMAWLFVPDRRVSDDRRLLLPVKGIVSGGAAAAGGPVQKVLACRVTGGALAWEAGLVDVPIRELLSDGQVRPRPGLPRVKRLEAAGWLRERLTRGLEGPLRPEAEAAGWSWITIRRALEDIGAVSERCPSTGRFRWRLKD
jgi:hypothetical protein